MSDMTYGIVGEDISVTVGSETYRAYSVSVNHNGNSVSARAFVDAPDEEAIVITSRSTDITLNFRFPPSLEVDDTVTLNITFGNDTSTYSAKVVSAVKSGTVDGVADFSANFRVLPGVAS